MKLPTFNLRWWFGLAAFAVIAALAALGALLMSRFVSSVMLEREVVMTREFLQGVIAAEALDADTFRPGKTERDSDLGSFVDHIRGMTETLRVNVYALDRSILWSTDAALIGRRFDGNDELEAAFSGKTISEVVSASGDVKPEHEALAKSEIGYFIEAYIPLHDKTHVITVVELYQIPVTLDATLRQGQRIVWLGAGAGAILLYAALFWIVARAARLIERQRTEISRMEALAALGQMAGGIAHNLRNPMAGIRSSAELMMLDFPEAGSGASDIIGEVDRLERRVRQLLEFTRTEVPAPRRLDPLALVNDTLGQQRQALERDGVEVTVEDDRNEKRMVEVDPILTGQALTTVIVNAREALTAGGRLRIRLHDRGRRVCINFTDDGPGIPSDALARVGEPFFTTKAQGLGLGLAMARRIVERFGGSLAVRNATGTGAEIEIELLVI
jgi:two-component system sensor histidine kinase HydH